MQIGQTYWSVFTDNGIRKARRHVWENHPVDVLHKSQNNVFNSKEEAEIYIVKTSYQIAK
jgi:hypothetical protein